MGNRVSNYKYKKLFDPRTFDIEEHIEYYQYIEHNYPTEDYIKQIESCYKYFMKIKDVNELEQYMNEGTYILALIQIIKKSDYLINRPKKMQYYDTMYKEVYDILKCMIE